MFGETAPNFVELDYFLRYEALLAGVGLGVELFSAGFVAEHGKDF